MASISTAISITDRMTGPIQNIISSVNSLISVTESMATSMDTAFDIHKFDDARRGLDLANQQMEEIIASTERARQGQDSYNDKIKDGNSAGKGLLSTVKSIAGAYLGLQGVQKLINASDTYVQTEARLNNMVGEAENLSQIQSQILASANDARAKYTDTAAAIAKMGTLAGDAFSDPMGNINTDELIKFTELMNKNFVVGGSSATEQASAMYQLTQAMAAGKLQGDEYRSIIENAPMLANAIEDYMVNVQNAEGSMKDWAAEGLLTADVIKAAMFNSAEEVEAKFTNMPMTWGQVWNVMGNYATVGLKPVLLAVSALANNMDIVAPIVLGVAAAFGIYTAAIAANSAAQGISNLIGFVRAKMLLANVNATLLATSSEYALAVATAQATVAQSGLNAVLAANPIMFIVMLIVVLIGMLYAGVAAYNKFTDSSISATGIIGGAFGILVAFIGNQLIFLWNMFAAIANFVANVFIDPVGAVKVLFYEMAQTVLGYLSTMAHGVEDVINKIPGVEVDITSGLDSFLSEIEAAASEAKSEADWFEFIGTKDYMDFSDAAHTGYAMGVNLENSIGDFFGGIGTDFDYTSAIPSNDEIAASTAQTAANTGDIANEIETTKENMEYLRKMAERDVVLRYMTPNINVDMSGMSNNIKNCMDIDGVIDHMVRKTGEAVESMAEGV